MLKMTGFGAVLVAVLMAPHRDPAHPRRRGGRPHRAAAAPAWSAGRPRWLAALILTLGASLLLGLLTALGLVAAGLPTRGRLGLRRCRGPAPGVAFAAVGRGRRAAHRQRPRGDRGIAVGVLAASFVLRAVGDISSPAGRAGCPGSHRSAGASRSARSAGDRWWVALVPARVRRAGGRRWPSPCWTGATSAPGCCPAPARPGHRRPRARHAARPGLAPAARLVPRLAGRLRVLALVLGNMASKLGGLLDSPGAQDLITRMGGVQGLTDAFLGTEFGAGGVVAAAYGVQAVLRLRGEESALRAEPVLATGVSRSAWVGQPPAGGAGDLGRPDAGHGPLRRPGATAPRTGDVPGTAVTMVGAGLARVPAVWVVDRAGRGAVRAAAAGHRGGLGRPGGLPRRRRARPADAAAGLGAGHLPVRARAQPSRRRGGVGADGGAAAVAALLLAVGLAGFRRRDLADPPP